MKSGAYPGSQAGGRGHVRPMTRISRTGTRRGTGCGNLRGQTRREPVVRQLQQQPADSSACTSTTCRLLSRGPARRWAAKPGACVPETMRFNGNGYYNGGSNTQNASCAQASSPSYNALNITSGPEIALWIWQQYLDNRQPFVSCGSTTR